MKEEKNRWYLGKGPVVIALITLGPLALPLVWASPQFSRNVKIIITVAVVVLTYFLTRSFIDSLRTLKDTLGQLNA